MGNQQSELISSIDKLVSLRKKPVELKLELSTFVELCPVDAPLPTKIDKRVFDIIYTLFQDEVTAAYPSTQQSPNDGNPKDSSNVGSVSDNPAALFDINMILQSMQRLLRIRPFYTSILRADLTHLITVLRTNDPIQLSVVLDTIASILNCKVVVDAKEAKEFNRDEIEAQAKFAFFEYKGYDYLCNLLIRYGRSEYTNIVTKLLDILSIDLVDHIHTTRFHVTQRILKILHPYMDLLLELTIHSDRSIRAYSIILLSGILLNSNLDKVVMLQTHVLKQAYILWYILLSIDAVGINEDHPYMKTYDKQVTLLARTLLGLVCSGHALNRSVVLSCIPEGLHGSIDDPLNTRVKIATADRDAKDTVSSTLHYAFSVGKIQRINCEQLFANLDEDIKLPHIVWVGRMKAELLDQLRNEIDSFYLYKAYQSDANWMYDAFEVSHPYLDKYCRVGNFFVSILIPALQKKDSGYSLTPQLMHQLLSALFQRAVIEDEPSWKLACMGAISTMYERHPDQFKELLIIPYYIYLLHPSRTDPIWRDHILRFMQTVFREPINAKRWLLFGGLEPLIYYLNIVHTVLDPQSVEGKMEAMPYLNRQGSLAVEVETNNDLLKLKVEGTGDVSEPSPSQPANSSAPLPSPSSRASVNAQSPLPATSPAQSQNNGNLSIVPTVPVKSSPVSPATPASASSPNSSQTPRSPHGPASTSESKVAIVVQAGGVRMKSKAESAWDWNDAKENLIAGLPEIFTPEEICARAVRLLRIIAFGGSKLRRRMCTKELLPALAKLLICPIHEIREDALRLLLDLLTTSPHMIPTLASTGLFLFCLLSAQYGMTENLGKLIERTHLRQSIEYVPEGKSALSPYLPAALIKVLESEGAIGFAIALARDTQTADIIWSADMRSHLFSSLEERLAPFRQQLRAQPDALLEWDVIIQPVVYSALDDEICVGGVYLSPLIHGYDELYSPLISQDESESTLPASITISHPEKFAESLYKALRSNKYNRPQKLDIIKSLIWMSFLYPKLDIYKRNSAVQSLVAFLTSIVEEIKHYHPQPSDPSPSPTDSESTSLANPIVGAMIASQYLCLVLQASIENCQSAFENKAIDIISSTLSSLISTSLNGIRSVSPYPMDEEDEAGLDLRRNLNSQLNNENSVAVQRTLLFLLLSLNSLSLKCSSANKFMEHEAVLLGIITEFARLGVGALFSTSSSSQLSGNALDLCVGAWKTIISISRNDRILEYFVKSGVFLYALYFVFFDNTKNESAATRDEENADVDEEKVDSSENVIEPVTSAPQESSSSSRLELRTAAARFIGLVKEKNTKKFVNLITTFCREYSSAIDNPSTFLSISQSFPEERRQKLKRYLIEQIRVCEDASGEWKEYSNDRISYQA